MTSAFNEAQPAISIYRPSRLVSEDVERSELWQQRLAEAVFGMTIYLVEKRNPPVIFEWLKAQSQIFSDLPDSQTAEYNSWKKVFFRAQALCEKFVVARYGHDELASWTRANAWVHDRLEIGRGGGAADVASRIARQADLYASEYDLRYAGYAEAEVVISHCAIWDYREKARASGIPITLRSPCEYCTKAISSNAAAKGYQAKHELFDDGPSHGCRWHIFKSVF